PWQIMTVADDPSLQFGTGEFTVVLVVHGFASPSTQLWGKGTDGLSVVLGSTIDAATPTASVGATWPLTDKFHVVTVRGPSLELRIDGGATIGATSTSDLSGDGVDLTIGVNGSNSAGHIDYLQVLAYKGPVSDAEIQALEAYLIDKYGLD